jgi:regulator of replication initiation timing
MKVIYNLFKSSGTIKSLKQEIVELTKENESLKEENQSVWEMLDEIKRSEQEAFMAYSSLNTDSIGDA